MDIPSHTEDEMCLLPELRQDLQIMQGTPHYNGQKSWVIFDPVRHQYFQVGEVAVHILGAWELGNASAILNALALQNITASEEDIKSLTTFLYDHQLTLQPIDNDFRNYAKIAATKDKKWWQLLIHQYLFIRIPLIRPHHFLKASYPYIQFVYSKAWLICIALIGVLGLYFTARQWDIYTQTFLHFFNTKGLAFYILSLIFVKIIHELGHAYTATRFGCRVTTMGVSFLVLFPVLYTDTTDSWRVPERNKRLLIDAAGISAELMLAIISTFLWVFLPEGIPRSIAFFVATTSWITSIAVNINPFLRFDGYYFLSDLIGVQNLQERSFAIGKWSLREVLFSLGDKPPESMSLRRSRALILYAWVTWIYRFFLFLGIALLIYTFTFKALGIALFIIEIIWFIGLPIYKEIKYWFSIRGSLIYTKHTYVTVSVITILALFSVIPWSSTLRIPAVIESSNHAEIFTADAGQITKIHVKNGEVVSRGDILITLSSPELEFELQETKHQIDLLDQRLGRITADTRERNNNLIIKRELAREQERLTGLQKRLDQLTLKAPINGRVTDLVYDLHPGRWVNETIQLAVIDSNMNARVRGFINAEDLRKITQGSKAKFIPDNLQLSKHEGVVTEISKANASIITIPSLTSRFDGPIAVAETDKLVPLQTWYSILINLNDESVTDRIQEGVILVKGSRESFAKKIWRQTMRILIRESSF